MVSLMKRAQRSAAVGLVVDVISGPLEQKPEERSNVLVVVDDQELRLGSARFHAYDVTRTSDFEGSYGIHTWLLAPFLRVRARTCLEMATFPEHLRPARAPSLAQNRAQSSMRQTTVLGLLACVFAAISMITVQGNQDTASPTLLGRPLHLDALGAPKPDAPLARRTAPGIAVRINRSGFEVAGPKTLVSLSGLDTGSANWARFTRGASRRTCFGRETIVVGPQKTEQFLTVDQRHGRRTWRWRLGSPGLTPRLGDDGAVSFVRGHALAPVHIAPVQILDAEGALVTPSDLHWSVRRSGKAWSLELRLDDSRLPAPYVIDPAVITRRSAATSTGSNGAVPNISIYKPIGIADNDVLVAGITVQGNRTITPPTGWQSIRRDVQTTNLTQQLFYKVAGSNEPGLYTWTFSASDNAVGGIVPYVGVNTASPIDQSSGNVSTSNSANVVATSITTTGANYMVVGFFGINKPFTFTPDASMTEQWDRLGTGPGSIASEAADYTAPAGATGNKTAVASGNNAWIGQLVSLKLDTAAADADALRHRGHKARSPVLQLGHQHDVLQPRGDRRLHRHQRDHRRGRLAGHLPRALDHRLHAHGCLPQPGARGRAACVLAPRRAKRYERRRREREREHRHVWWKPDPRRYRRAGRRHRHGNELRRRERQRQRSEQRGAQPERQLLDRVLGEANLVHEYDPGHPQQGHLDYGERVPDLRRQHGHPFVQAKQRHARNGRRRADRRLQALRGHVRRNHRPLVRQRRRRNELGTRTPGECIGGRAHDRSRRRGPVRERRHRRRCDLRDGPLDDQDRGALQRRHLVQPRRDRYEQPVHLGELLLRRIEHDRAGRLGDHGPRRRKQFGDDEPDVRPRRDGAHRDVRDRSRPATPRRSRYR